MSRKIGIMADSHGRAETIAAAIQFLQGRRCRRIYHLGDICDSIKPATVERCVAYLQENDVLAIKGNNDHAMVANQAAAGISKLPTATLGYLKALPLLRYDHGACLTHSLPFVGERGLSSMIGAMDETEARHFFKIAPQGLLFRGHSHNPEVISMDRDKIQSYPLKKKEVFKLKPNMPSIVTCGALARGLCMIWRPVSGTIECLEYSMRD